MTVKYLYFFFQYCFPTSSLLGDVVFGLRNEYFSGYRERKSVSFARSWILPWLSIQITNTVKIFIKSKCGPGEHQKAARYGQVQPEVWSSLKTSSFPPLPCFSMILPKEGHPEHHFWKCIGKKQFGIPENGNKKLLFPDTAVKAIFNSIL